MIADSRRESDISPVVRYSVAALSFTTTLTIKATIPWTSLEGRAAEMKFPPGDFRASRAEAGFSQQQDRSQPGRT
jgi:hypothetical protein